MIIELPLCCCKREARSRSTATATLNLSGVIDLNQRHVTIEPSPTATNRRPAAPRLYQISLWRHLKPGCSDHPIDLLIPDDASN